MDNSCIWSKTAPFSFENGLVWTGPECQVSVYGLLLGISKAKKRKITSAESSADVVVVAGKTPVHNVSNIMWR